MGDARTAVQVSDLVARASRLRLDAATVEIVDAFDAAGVHARLLKGPTFEDWLYGPSGQREYADCDVLVPRSDLSQAEQVLESLSYRRRFDDRAMPAWWREHATAWARDRDRLSVDVHRSLVGIGVNQDTAWRRLSADVALVPVAGRPVPALALPARALHVALHAAQHGVGWPRPLIDLERALARVDDDLWRAAATLAAELDAIDAFFVGLRLKPAGVALTERLGLPGESSVYARLRATTPPPTALGFEQLARADGKRQQAAILWRKFVPPPTFVRHWDPRAADSRVSLVRAYLRRPVWLACQAPRGFRAWRASRCSVRVEEPED